MREGREHRRAIVTPLSIDWWRRNTRVRAQDSRTAGRGRAGLGLHCTGTTKLRHSEQHQHITTPQHHTKLHHPAVSGSHCFAL
ncbi:hypothetical protein E2C01_054721 [Portunus trituberculatus]|uniref:Uncharacterized protein n=1 Tax=Portunus trituberculatus TaxID=210409 RepID=A0A5B7GSZ8_PORTR|nr:hypothetical protein [Portunus trituberculatus]